MNTKLKKYGNKLALIIDKSTLKSLNIDENTNLQLSVKGKNLIVAPVLKKKGTTKKNKSDVLAIAKNIAKEYDVVFKKLAKT